MPDPKSTPHETLLRSNYFSEEDRINRRIVKELIKKRKEENAPNP